MVTGRPTKFTDEIKQNILIHIENGATYTRACVLAGVSQAVFQLWKRRGLDDERSYNEQLEDYHLKKTEYERLIAENKNKTSFKTATRKLKKLSEPEKTEFLLFLENIKKAKQTYIAWLQEKANDGAKVDGKLALEILARKQPEEFGRRDKLDIRGQFDYNKFDVELTPEEEAAYKERLKDMYGGGDDE